MVSYLVSLLLVCTVAFAAVTHQDRVHDQKLSDKEPGSPDYDHEAFLGKEEAEEFDNLSEEESKRRLGIIVDKIDKDNDGQLTEEELKNWIIFTQSRYVQEDTEKQLKQSDANSDKKVTWEEYKTASYGFMETDTENKEEYEKMMARDKVRFDAADADNNGECTVDEFRAFLHPEEFEHMKDIVTKETMDEIDKNKDGFVDVSEYIGDMTREEGEEEPDWVATEREQFAKFRDVNKDGKLDMQEVRSWIMPDDYNHADAEAKHLIYEADDNKDGSLNKEEVLAHHDTFAGSQATDWGDALKRHDEF